ncbi:MAG: ThuA domain-containing protein [Bacteroidota bacterium]
MKPLTDTKSIAYYSLFKGLVFICFILFCPLQNISAQSLSKSIARFTVTIGEKDRSNTPVNASLQGITLQLEDYQLNLYEVTGGDRKLMDAQLDLAYIPHLSWILAGKSTANTERIFELVQEDKSEQKKKTGITLKDNGEAIEVKRNEQPVLNYHYAITPPPKGVSELYERGGYIHPLWSPKGSVLTRIQPSDHYHHYGIWNPWTHTKYKDREIDFWNLIKGHGTIKVNETPVYNSGDVFGEMEVRQEHVVFEDSTRQKEETALRETYNLKIWNTENTTVDFTSIYRCGTENPLILEKYRYQGFGYRARASWDDSNVHLLTSSGKNKQDGNATRARWCMISGPTESGESGALFMTYPTNYNFPEMIRIWPKGNNKGVENVFLNFNPTMDRDWVLESGKQYSLKYRMVLFEGQMDASTAESYWHDFAHPPVVKITPLLTNPKAEIAKRILLYTKNGEGYVHKNIPNSIEAIKQLGKAHHFEVDASEDPSVFTAENLAKYDALVFSNTNNSAFDSDTKKASLQRAALQDYIRKGGSFVGIHSASGSERDWPWYWQLLGGKFKRHAPFQEFDIHILNANHPSTASLPTKWTRSDECYYLTDLNPDINVLLAADMNSVEDEKKGEYPGNIFGEKFPLAWYHYFDGGRQWYTSLGHEPEDYKDPVFLEHILGGILWAIDGKKSNIPPPMD